MVSSSTGSGKTASFVLPALTRVLAAREAQKKDAAGARSDRNVPQGPRVLILAPTRELAMQVAKATVDYGRHVPGLRVATVVGGVPYGAQLKALRGPLDVLIATPGRLIDHMESGRAMLANIETAGARRSRPHAGHGFHRPHPPHRRRDAGHAPDDDVQRHVRRPCRPPGRAAAARPATHRHLVAHRRPCRHRTTPALGRRPAAQERAARPHPDRAQHGAGGGLHQHPARRRLAGRPPRRHGPPCRVAARRPSAGPAHARAARPAQQAAEDPGRHRRGVARHRRAEHQPRHQLRPADEGRGLRAPHRPHRPCRPRRPGGDAGRAHATRR